jgi:hypothetical protein
MRPIENTGVVTGGRVMSMRTVLRGGVIGACLAALPALGQTFSFVSDRLALDPAVTPGAFLTDSNVSAVDAFLSGQSVRVVKVVGDLSPATVAAIYGKYRIDFTFADFETADAVARTRSLVEQIRASAGTGAAVASNQAFIGNFNFYPAVADRTAPGSPATYASYFASGANLAAEELYPGSPSFRNPASRDSSAPNVRSALFALPIERLTVTTVTLPAGHAHVAFVNRFNNWGNPALDSDGNSANGYAFVTNDQLPSRGDFRAQVLHYRLRGATGVQGLDGGVVGYSQKEFQADLAEGWRGTPEVREVLADPDARPATLDTHVKSDGAIKSMEDAGVVVSGTYSDEIGKLVLLVSNLDASGHQVGMTGGIGGRSVPGAFFVPAGSHQILEFDASGTKWNLAETRLVFADNDRAGTGVPEPGCLSIVAAASLLAARRQRRC